MVDAEVWQAWDVVKHSKSVRYFGAVLILSSLNLFSFILNLSLWSETHYCAITAKVWINKRFSMKTSPFCSYHNSANFQDRRTLLASNSSHINYLWCPELSWFAVLGLNNINNKDKCRPYLLFPHSTVQKCTTPKDRKKNNIY